MKLEKRCLISILCGEGVLVHEEQVNVGDVVYQEGLVTGWGHVSSLLVGSVTDLYIPEIIPVSSSEFDMVPTE